MLNSKQFLEASLVEELMTVVSVEASRRARGVGCLSGSTLPHWEPIPID